MLIPSLIEEARNNYSSWVTLGRFDSYVFDTANQTADDDMRCIEYPPDRDEIGRDVPGGFGGNVPTVHEF